MHLFVASSMEVFELVGFELFLYDAGSNEIGAEGCRYLSQGRWNKL